MREVTEKLTDLQASSIGDSELEAFQKAAEQWAVFALRNFVGDHLTKALDVSKAMALYVAYQAELRK